VEPVLHVLEQVFPFARAAEANGTGDAAAEIRRLYVRLVPGALSVNPLNKTALLLSGGVPPDDLLPLGDLYATEVLQLAGGWSVPAPIRGIVAASGGIERLDAALRRHIDGREPDALAALPPSTRDAVLRALQAGRAARLWGSVVPKLGSRTVGVDLFE
jgi:hypothetical protein